MRRTDPLALVQEDPLRVSKTVTHRVNLLRTNAAKVAKDPAEAVRWWRMAAASGKADSQYKLACAHREGQGVIESEVLAAMWFRRACLRFLATAERERATECVESIRRLPGPPNLALVLELEESINDEEKTPRNWPGGESG